MSPDKKKVWRWIELAMVAVVAASFLLIYFAHKKRENLAGEVTHAKAATRSTASAIADHAGTIDEQFEQTGWMPMEFSAVPKEESPELAYDIFGIPTSRDLRMTFMVPVETDDYRTVVLRRPRIACYIWPGKWFMACSVGPDRRADFAAVLSMDSMVELEDLSSITYDSTNGTHSSGDILHVAELNR